MTRYAVTIKAFGHTSVRIVEAFSPEEARDKELDRAGVSIKVKAA